MRERFYHVVGELLDEDERIAVVTAVISAGHFRQDGTAARHPTRVVDVGIREQLQIGVAAGMALEGFRPIVHTYAPFLVERPYEQIKLDLGHQGVGAILVSIGASYDSAASGRTHQAPEDVALIATLPGFAIHVPGHPDEVETILRRAAAGHGLDYIRLAGDTNQTPIAASAGGFTEVRSGSTGAPVVVAVGPMLDRVLAATGHRDVTVLYATTIRPFDAATLRRVAGPNPDVVMVEPYLAGTLAADVTAVLADRPSRLANIGVPREESRRYGSPASHDAAYGLDTAGIRAQLDSFLGP